MALVLGFDLPTNGLFGPFELLDFLLLLNPYKDGNSQNLLNVSLSAVVLAT